ncbi:MAG: hypothetical protein JNJ99_00610, partial [Crocinitomicaceae bacterium]|nr:hypothetical protein [Crocinitomicaceae bacterium]
QLNTLFYKTSSSGSSPEGDLIQANNGKLYGLMMTEGINNAGTIFEFDIDLGAFTKLADFTPAVTGENPRGTLIQGSNGKLYGMTQTGGSSDYGVIFEYDITGATLNPIHEFVDYLLGAHPHRGALIEQGPGLFVGMVSGGGLAGYGVIFEFNSTTSNYQTRIDINTKNGYVPHQSLLLANDGTLYGVTSFGGSYNKGVVFSYDPGTNTFINKASFDGASLGSSPKSSLIQASNGKIYGTTYDGGINNLGVIFEYDPIIDTLINLFDFDGAINGQNPSATLLEASNGKFYGVTPQGGTNNVGVLFEYDPLTDIYINKINFDGASFGSSPYGGLFLSSNNKIYGLTHGGGTFGSGILFEYDYLSNILLPL